ncbi:MAG TPA: hypothetical protein VGS17_07710 [Candidatus Limnocylindria bacterium]|nr:hypothetical protein [Candidatus Limnocylindria bacterium]
MAKACEAARLLLAGNGPAALAQLRDAYEECARRGLEAFPALLVVVFARVLARKGVCCTDPVIDRVRSFAERARADWWLTELEAAGRGA